MSHLWSEIVPAGSWNALFVNSVLNSNKLRFYVWMGLDFKSRECKILHVWQWLVEKRNAITFLQKMHNSVLFCLVAGFNGSVMVSPCLNSPDYFGYYQQVFCTGVYGYFASLSIQVRWFWASDCVCWCQNVCELGHMTECWKIKVSRMCWACDINLNSQR